MQGNNVTLFAMASGTPTLSYQWYFSSGLVSGATATNLPILNFQSANQGKYRVVAMNTAGSVTSEVAILYLADPLRFVSNSIASGNFQFRLVGRAASNFVLEASSALSSWTSLSTNLGPLGIIDGSVPVTNTRYFRARLFP